MLRILAVPAFEDNYLWLIHNRKHAIVVDPGDAAPILTALEVHKLSLTGILVTHHHRDHIGGVPDLLKRFMIPVFGPRNEKITGVTYALSDGDKINLPELPLLLTVLEVPGHTSGHIAYVANSQGLLFCGDTLFAGGCGRLFEGIPAQMIASLEKLAALPDETLVFCAHEYTLSNLRFAQEVEPHNAKLIERIKHEHAKREQGQPTIPSTIGLEKLTNPFLRYREPEIIHNLISSGHLSSQNVNDIAVFAALREWKNVYK